MKYKDAIRQSMERIAQDPNAIFLGYNVTRGSKAYGTLANIPPSQCIETPLAENLMADLAIGLALEGYHPVLFFERHDFMLISLDALVNHLEKLQVMSKGEFTAPVMIRAVVGGTMPFHPGIQHTQDFTPHFKQFFSFPVHVLETPEQIFSAYAKEGDFKNPSMFIERRDLYETDDGK